MQTQLNLPITVADPRRPAQRTKRPVFGSPGSRPRFKDIDQLLTTRDVVAITGKHRCTLYRWMLAGQFPLKHSARGRATGWLRSDIESWLAGDQAKGRPPG